MTNLNEKPESNIIPVDFKIQDQDGVETVTHPLSSLILSPLNPRQDVADTAIQALALSIKACGLLQNLIGIEDGENIAIVAGGRRLRALKKLASEGEISTETPVLVRMASDVNQAIEWANAENNAREDLTPAEEVRAYRTMAESGLMISDIAIAFAKTERHIQGRLRLAFLADPVLDALDKGDISLGIAAAFTVSNDHDRQSQVLVELQRNPWMMGNAAQIKRALMNEAVSSTDKIAQLVGRDAYEEAGGAIREDLFGEEVFFLDPDCLSSLAMGVLKEAEGELLSEGWKWVKTSLDYPDYQERSTYERTHPERQALTDEEEALYDHLTHLIENDEASDEERDELNGLEDKAKERFSDIQKAHAGVLVNVTGNGRLEYAHGLIASDDVEDAVEAGVIEVFEPSKTAKSDKSKGPYSMALQQDLATIRTGAIQAALLANPKLALDIAIFALSSPIYAGSSPFLIQSTKVRNFVGDDHGQDLPEELSPDGYRTPMQAHEAAEAFAAFQGLSPKMKSALLAEEVATSFMGCLTLDEKTNPLVELIAHLTKVNVRQTWTPTSAFFKRLTSDQLDGVMAYILGKDAPVGFRGSAKRDKVARLHALFNNPQDRKGLATDEKKRIADWIPEGMETKPTVLPEEAEKPSRKPRKATKKVSAAPPADSPVDGEKAA